jgi:hypothetical protein
VITAEIWSAPIQGPPLSRTHADCQSPSMGVQRTLCRDPLRHARSGPFFRTNPVLLPRVAVNNNTRGGGC